MNCFERQVDISALLDGALNQHQQTELLNHIEECRGGQGGFYFYLTLRNIQTDSASPFFSFLSRKTGNIAIDGPPDEMLPRVIYLPGEFCVHPKGTSVNQGLRQFRLSYGYEEVPVILKALEYMREAILYAESQTS